jgi:hypothetical protein
MGTGRYGVAIRIPLDCLQTDQLQMRYVNQSGTGIVQEIGVYKQSDLSTALYSNVHNGGGTPGVPYDITLNPTEFLDGRSDVYLYIGIQNAGNFNVVIRIASVRSV